MAVAAWAPKLGSKVKEVNGEQEEAREVSIPNDFCRWWFQMDVSINGGTQQPWVFLLKMIILGCFGGTPIFGNTQIPNVF